MAVIFYFSGTGNSLAAAKALAAAVPDCRLEPMAAYLARPYAVTDEVVGIACPVHCFALPLYVEQFLGKLQAQPAYCFGVVTMGANQGRALKQLQELLAQRSITLHYAGTVAMPDNFFITPQRKAAAMLQEAEAKLEQHAAAVAGRRQDISQCQERALWKHVGIPGGYWFMRNVLHIGQLSLRQNRCNGCGLCAKICPVGNIVMEKGTPSFGRQCAWCFGCRNWCPQHAIRMGGMKAKSEQSYTNPQITVQDMQREVKE